MKLDLKVCVRCEKLFSSPRDVVCSSCMDEEEADFLRIRNVLRDEPGLSTEETAEKAQVSVECVMRMLDQGWIENTAMANPVTCGHCGAPAISTTKRLCAACIIKLDQQYAVAIREMRERISPKKSAKKTDVQQVRQMVDEKRKLMDMKGSLTDRKRRDWLKPRLPE
jgi:hypothetical protein